MVGDCGISNTVLSRVRDFAGLERLRPPGSHPHSG